MCLIINEKKHKNNKPKKAKKDIVCWKGLIIKNECISPLFYHEWELGREYNVSMKIYGNTYHRVDEGFHAYRNKKGKNAKMIIPKGSYYFISDDKKEIVSDRMKLVKIL